MKMEKEKNKAGKRQAMRERQRKAKQIRLYSLAGVGVVAVALIGFLIWQNFSTAYGGTVNVQATEAPVLNSQHIAEGSDPGQYNTDPPSSGMHFSTTLPVKFYEESDLAALGPYPQGHLVHNLEHGHVIFWYNCDLLDANACTQLKTQIKDVMQRFNGFKVLAFPWKSLKVPVTITSWSRTYPMESFDPEIARAYVAKYRNQAPEPNAE